MIPFNHIKVFKFAKLTELKKLWNHEYDDYLILCIGDISGVWYPLQKMELWDSYRTYIKDKFGFIFSNDIDRIMSYYNCVVRTESFECLEGTVQHYKRNAVARTKSGIVLSTKLYPELQGGMYWHTCHEKIISKQNSRAFHFPIKMG